ncbi:hypothetical protein [[Leptolyngbya] sp. PCC 7376]|uniref:hypothetical protein n=1 Tax=[Leptolyngbya] sp. PCC 7376 TaxID=111781 RepID=UPI001358BD52|nr:hypothetical protein [[Leptolyngbya] sp. PCC 7376]
MLFPSTQQPSKQPMPQIGDRMVVENDMSLILGHESMTAFTEKFFRGWRLPEGNLNLDQRQPHFNEFYEIQPCKSWIARINHSLDFYLNLIGGRLRLIF